MTELGLPVPPGFTVPTTVARQVAVDGWAAGHDEAIRLALAELEAESGRRLGSEEAPLLVSVRSGAAVSMPGMMDTVLNVGMTPAVAAGLGREAGDERFGWDTYRRFVESYAGIVHQLADDGLRAGLAAAGGDRPFDDLDGPERAEAITSWLEALAADGVELPADPVAQVVAAVRAVFASWSSDRAEVYRRKEGISSDLGTAATVQAMVFGNRGDRSGTGVAFSRDPSTGEERLTGDFLVGAQGEDVVAGTHRTMPIDEMMDRWPALGRELATMAADLERELADMVDIEFTVDDGRLWLLQVRSGKRSARAAVRMAVAMAEDPDFPLDRAGAVDRVVHLLDEPPTLPAPALEPDAVVVAEGLAAPPGRAVGVVCLDPDDAVTREARGEAVILVRAETSPADVHGMAAARGLVTTTGGLVSHAAVVARSWGIPAVVGAGDVVITDDGIVGGGQRVAIGTEVTVDGDLGLLLLGDHQGSGGQVLPEVDVVRGWRRTLSPDPAPDSTPDSGPDGADGPLDLVDCRRTLALKGMATADVVAANSGVGPAAAAAALEALVEQGHADAVPGDRFRLTPEGTAAIDAVYRAEAERWGTVVEAQLDRFHELNLRFKQLVTDWQMRPVDGELVMNEHDDADYDRAVIDTLADEIDAGIGPVIDELATSIERLGVYRLRFGHALDALRAGDAQMMASPLRESYHTVWFELHEELIRLSGRNRADETAAGRA